MSRSLWVAVLELVDAVGGALSCAVAAIIVGCE